MAIEVDKRVLEVGSEGSSGDAVYLRQQGDAVLKSPHAWASSTDTNVREARKWIADSVRLRKAVRAAVGAAREQEHGMARALNAQMLKKIGSTRQVKAELGAQLQRVREEQSKTEQQRQSLVAALEAKRGPLAQAKVGQGTLIPLLCKPPTALAFSLVNTPARGAGTGQRVLECRPKDKRSRTVKKQAKSTGQGTGMPAQKCTSRIKMWQGTGIPHGKDPSRWGAHQM